MKRFTFFLVLFCLVCGISGCRNTKNEQRSKFFATFTIGEIVEENDQYLIPEARSLGGTEAGPNKAPYQKHEEMIVQIDPADRSDFIEAVKTDIAQAIVDSGASIDGQGGSFQNPIGGQAGIDYISYRYSQNGANGIINLYGVPGEGTNYTLIVVLTES